MDLYNTLLVSLEMSESDRRLLMVLLVIFVVILLLAGFIGMLVRYLSNKMGERIETDIAEAVKYRIIENHKSAMKYGRRKNARLFFKAATPSMACLAFILVFWLIYSLCTLKNGGFGANHFANFNDLLFKFDATWEKDFLGFYKLMALSVKDYPTFVGGHWASYLIVTVFIIATVYLFVVSQAFLARAANLRRVVDEVYKNSLKGFNFFDETAKAAEQERQNKQ
ncbi:MAG: hypothetical protein MJ241_03330 [Bacilli bacterium]|nr:hypothetical protein [Bacilli bacterium]